MSHGCNYSRKPRLRTGLRAGLQCSGTKYPGADNERYSILIESCGNTWCQVAHNGSEVSWICRSGKDAWSGSEKNDMINRIAINNGISPKDLDLVGAASQF